MKKILFVLSLLFSVVVFSAPKDGNYYVEKESSQWSTYMSIIVKNNKILSINFDKKNKEGLKFTMDIKENEKYKAKYGKTFREISTQLSRDIITKNQIDFSSINDKKTVEEFNELLNFLIEKSEKGETGNFKL